MMGAKMSDGADVAGGPERLRRAPWQLMRAAAGTPGELGKKAVRLAQTLRAWSDDEALGARLEALRASGLIDRVPTKLQIALGSLDMLRFWISPAAADYYASKGISFAFHQVLRVLDDPAAMIDPVGFFVERDAIIGHVLQVVHANPLYDLQLLATHPDGLDALVAQTRAIIAGTHPRQRGISAIVEEPDYHARLLAYVEAFRRDPTTPPLLRANIAADTARYGAIERTFGTLPAAVAYFCRLPTSLPAALRHLTTVRTFPLALAAPIGPPRT